MACDFSRLTKSGTWLGTARSLLHLAFGVAMGSTCTAPTAPVPVAFVSLSPATAAIVVGATQQLTATAKGADGQELSGRPIAWTSSDPAKATVSTAGLVTGIAVGSVTISATSEGRSGTASVSVLPVPVASLTVTPQAASIIVGATRQLTVTVSDADGNPLTGRTVVWTSSDPTRATVSTSGLVTGVAVGSATVTATCEGKSASAEVTVDPLPQVALTRVILPSDLIVSGSRTEIAHVVTLAANGDTLTGRTVTWVSSNPQVATIDASGRISALAAGMADLTATVEGTTGGAGVTVEPRAKYERPLNETWWFFDGTDPRMPIWDFTRQGFVPRPEDHREQIVIDETFSVPAGSDVRWENKIVWVRPHQRRNIMVFGKLTVSNSLLLWDQTQHQQAALEVKGGGTLRVENSYAFSSNPFWVSWDYQDHAVVALDHFQGDPWTTSHGKVTYSAVNASSVRMTLLGHLRNASIMITDAHQTWLELFPPAGTHQLSLPGRATWQDWRPPGLWPGSSIDVQNSYIVNTDLSLNNDVNVTISDTPAGFQLGWQVHKDTPGYVECELRNLGNPDDDAGVFYTDATWSLPCNNSSLTIRNSRLLRTWPNVYGFVHLKVHGSNLVDVRNFGGGGGAAATYEVYNSTMDLLSATNGGLMYVENSRIRYDIQVNGAGSIIYSYGLTSRASGPFSVYEESGGRYVVRTSPGVPWN